MSTGTEQQVLKQLFDFARSKRDKILYPGLPFILVPTLLASLIASQFGGSLTHYPDDKPAALELSVRFDRVSGKKNKATLIIVPPDADFFLPSSGSGINSAWLSMDSSKLSSNNGKITLSNEGLDVGTLRGVGYPLVVFVEGEHENKIDPLGTSPQDLPRLELSTALSNWIVFFLLGGAIFGFGASTGFVNDGSVAKNKNASVDKSHHE